MKHLKLVSVLTVAAFAVLTLATVSAAEPLLSPRAKANQIVRIAGTEADHLDRGLPTASPKALAAVVPCRAASRKLAARS